MDAHTAHVLTLHCFHSQTMKITYASAKHTERAKGVTVGCMDNPMACIIAFLANSPQYRRYINATDRGIDSDELDIDYHGFKEAYDYCEAKVQGGIQ